VTVFVRRFSPLCGLLSLLSAAVGQSAQLPQQVHLPPGGEPVIASDAHLTTSVGGLEQTNANANVVETTGQGFSKAIRVTIRKDAIESNATQLTMPISRSVAKGDVLMASFYIRGSAASGPTPAHIVFLFERTESPWTKSVTQDATSAKAPGLWRHVFVPFQASESYEPKEAMVSLRFAVQPQTVELGGLSVLDYGQKGDLDALVEYATGQDPVGKVSAKVDFAAARQRLLGFGGDFCQPRYGSVEPMDVVGRYALDHLHVVHARIGLPLNYWTPRPGEYRDDAQAHAALLALQDMTRRHIPTVLSVWEGPLWMLGGNPEQSGRKLDPSKYDICVDAIVRFLTTARDKYGAKVDNFSFNEPDYGVNFSFTSKTMADFIRTAGPKFKAAGLTTKFIIGDTTGGSPLVRFVSPLLKDPSVAPYLGPLGFHCWDGLGASEASYEAIAALGKAYNKPVWCLEAGFDSGLWQAPSPWATWDNGLRTGLVYARTLQLSGASLMDYWTYQDNYPIVNKEGPRPYPVFFVIKQMEQVCLPGAHVVDSRVSNENLQVLVTAGPDRGRFSALIVNPKGSGSVTLSGLPANADVQVIASDKASQGRSLGSLKVSVSGSLTLELPSRSVITLLGTSRGQTSR